MISEDKMTIVLSLFHLPMKNPETGGTLTYVEFVSGWANEPDVHQLKELGN